LNVKLFVGNLPKSITQEELSTLFTQAGEVIVTDIVTYRNNGKPKGLAFVTMSNKNEAEKAIHMFNASSFNDMTLKVNIAQPPFEL